MKKLYQKYKDWVVITLVLLFAFKSCQSCSRNRLIKFNEAKYTNQIDSLNDSINNYIFKVQSIEDSLNMYKNMIHILKDNNDILLESNKHYRTTNNILIKTNKEIINKTDK